ncbi:uncharacterized protein VTP21DRAFT_3992 [Calcarisporiella thermophila]|uniref:uncharacterized protein n=1 Tax=Calcarisporiella thermophila TaxID=911321 RepID=UPI0037448D99
MARRVQITDLPEEILVDNIFAYLSNSSLAAAAQSCKFFARLIEDESIWKHKCLNEFNFPDLVTFRQLGWRTLYRRLRHPRVYTWGSNDKERLGYKTPPVHTRRYPHYMHSSTPQYTPREVESLRDKGVVGLVAGGWGFHVVDYKGRVWAWGVLRENGPVLEEPTQLDLPESIRVISSGRGHVVALSKNEQIWQWEDYGEYHRIELRGNRSRIKQINAGWTHSLALTEDGKMWIWDKEDHTATTWVSLSDVDPGVEDGNDTFVQVAGGESFSIALTAQGRIFKFEYRRQMEQSGEIVMTPPQERYSQLLNFIPPANEKITHISAAFRAFSAYTPEGTVLIGNDESTAASAPSLIPELQRRGVCQITLGDWHKGCLTERGEILTWGTNDQGALGLGREVRDEVVAPTLVKDLGLERGYLPFQIAFAGWHSGALVVPL